MVRSIPRRPEVPGAPGVALPPRGGLMVAEEVRDLLPRDDEEPTTPRARRPSGVTVRATTLAVNDLTKAEAGQLAAIFFSWECGTVEDRKLLAEFAKRLLSNKKLKDLVRDLHDREE